MTQAMWTAVDAYLTGLYVPADPVLDAALAASEAAGLPPIQVSPCQGKLLMLLALVQRAERILEIGTLGGYSAIWLARALPPGGRLVTLELEEKHAVVARENVRRAGLAHVVELRLGRAADRLAELVAERAAPFDLVFIDADKPSNPEYLEWALALSRPGTLIVVDNVVRGGEVLDERSGDATIRGVRRFHEACAANPRLMATAVQTVGSKGYDGFTLAVVTCEPGD